MAALRKAARPSSSRTALKNSSGSSGPGNSRAALNGSSKTKQL